MAGVQRGWGAAPFAMACLLALWMTAAAQADTPGAVRYQGVLTDELGVVLPDGVYHLRFRIYPAPAGGAAVFDQTLRVRVTDGLYAVILSSWSPGVLPGDLALGLDEVNQGRFLQITVESDPGGDLAVPLDLLPRQELASVPYALSTGRADDAQALDVPAPPPLPSNAIILWDDPGGVCPPGFTEVAALRRHFPVGANLAANDPDVAEQDATYGEAIANVPGASGGRFRTYTNDSVQFKSRRNADPDPEDVAPRGHTHNAVPPLYTLLACRKT